MADTRLVNVPHEALEKLLAEVRALLGKVKRLEGSALDVAHKEFDELRKIVGWPRLG